MQPHSGSQANAAVYAALLEMGTTCWGWTSTLVVTDARSPVNFSGKTQQFHAYGLDENELIDYDRASFG